MRTSYVVTNLDNPYEWHVFTNTSLVAEFLQISASTLRRHFRRSPYGLNVADVKDYRVERFAR